MRVAICQYDISPDPQVNLDYLRIEASTLRAESPDLLVLPEFCLTGYGNPPSSIALEEDSSTLAAMREIAAEVGCPIAGGYLVHEGKSFFNRLLLMDADGILASYDKQRLFSHWEEDLHYSAGKQSCRVVLPTGELACFICYDLRFPELFREVMDCPVFIVIANWPSKRIAHWDALLKARAIENQAYVVGVNRIGASATITFSGQSAIYNHLGESVLNLGDAQESALLELDIEAVNRYREDFPVLRDAVRVW